MSLECFPKPSIINNLVHGRIKKFKTLITRAKKIRLYPTKEQRRIIKRNLDSYRYGYNLAVKKYKQTGKIARRDEILEQLTPKQLDYAKNRLVYNHIFADAIRDFNSALKSARTNKREGNIKNFRMRYKKDGNIQTMRIPREAFSKTKNAICYSLLGELSSSESIKGSNQTSRLQWNFETGHIYLFIPYERKKYDIDNKKKLIALDPGIRVFQTSYGLGKEGFYSPTETIKFNQGVNKIKKLNDKLNKKKCNAPWYKRYYKRVRNKIRNIVTELHWKTSLTLVRNYKTILLGNMSTKGICSKTNGLKKEVKQICYHLSPYTFRRRLIEKAQEYNSEVFVIKERDTSRTCGNCKRIKYDLGKAEVFRCNYCHFVINRDVNGARNIMLRHLELFTPIY